MLDVTFAQPEWIYGLWGVLILGAMMVILELRRPNSASYFVRKPMQDRLARTCPLSYRLVAHFLGMAALVCFVVALMRPQYGFREKEVPHVGAQIMICLDVSKSMLAEDASPNRLERAKSELEVLLNYLDGDQVGLIAFAGKALVMCPMTTDFGFLKMVMKDTTCSSIGRGGTSLEAPIRRATAGFSDKDGMSKVILLITDGEDNGSKPLDAAREAAERGVRIISVGFGHERGSRIEVTDPSTGLQTYVKDRNGEEVISRLDLDMLKELALITNGVMIPARVGSLDVESIHQQHIQPLMRASGKTKLVVQNEAFQYPLMAGVVLVLLSFAFANPLAFSSMKLGDWLLARSTAKVIPFVLMFCIANVAWAQTSQQPFGQNSTGQGIEKKSNEADEKQKGLGSEFSSRSQENRIPENPLDCYNLSLSLLQSDSQYAEQLLEEARKNAGENADLRFRSSYNLGWVKVNQANEKLESQPTEALKQLRAAADWFRESVRLRPQSESARQNLEIILKRIAELNDSINRADPKKFEQQLDQLIQRQSELVKGSRRLIQQVQKDAAGNGSEEVRKSFKLASVDQRLLNSDLQEASIMASQLVEEFRNKASKQNNQADSSEADAEEKLRMAQMSQALVYANRAAQRLGQARSQLRLRNAQRAALRGVLGLDELKRARDQMRDPAATLRQIIADSELLRQQTLAFVAGKNRLAAFLESQSNLPSWLNREFLVQSQATQKERTQELAKTLESIHAGQTTDPNANRVRSKDDTVALAGELVSRAANEFEKAQSDLDQEKNQSAETSQRQGIQLLREAYEQFADLKGLIELTYQGHVALDENLPNARNLSGEVLAQVAESFQKTTTKNGERLLRIADKITEKIEETKSQADEGSNAGAAPGANSGQGKDVSNELNRLEFATQLTRDITERNEELQATFQEIVDQPSHEIDWDALEKKSGELEEKLTELRRLFYSIIEQLKETALRQQQLNSDTDQALAKQSIVDDDTGDQADPNKVEEPKDEKSNRLKPLGSRQAELSDISEKIGDGLRELAEGLGQQVQPGVQANQPEKQMAQKYSDASTLVKEGQTKMKDATTELNGDAGESGKIQALQLEALEKLQEALRLLDDQNNQQDQDQNSQPNQSKDDQGKNNDSNQALLQRIRDMEAQRRKNRSKSPFAEQVEKDW